MKNNGACKWMGVLIVTVGCAVGGVAHAIDIKICSPTDDKCLQQQMKSAQQKNGDFFRSTETRFGSFFRYFKFFLPDPDKEKSVDTPIPDTGTSQPEGPTPDTSDKKDPCAEATSNKSGTSDASGSISVDVNAPAPVKGQSTGCLQVGVTPPVSSGARHTCALLNGEVQCWGSNEFGQLGDGTTINTNKPVKVSTAGKPKPEVAGLTAGKSHTCMLLKDKTVQCWGKNDFGQLGVDSKTTLASNVPVTVPLKDVVLVTAGGSHTCAKQIDNTVYCWGNNEAGQLGVSNITTPKSDAPVKVGDSITGKALIATTLSAGKVHTCAVVTDSSVRCWGSNDSEQLGVGKIANSSVPLAVMGADGKSLIDIASVSAGGAHTCVVTTKGGSLCWGYNDEGQLGVDSKTIPTSNNPKPVLDSNGTTVTGINLVSSGGSHTCERSTGSTIKCFGYNASGQLGSGNAASQSAAIPIDGLLGVTAVSAGLNHTCVMIDSKAVKCWGSNKYGQLGDGTNDNKNVPTAIVIVTSQP